MVDTCSGEFESNTPYYYSCYEDEDENIISDNKENNSYRFWTNKNRSRNRI